MSKMPAFVEGLFDVHARLFRAERPALEGLRLAPASPRHPAVSVVTAGFPREVWARLPLCDRHEPEGPSAEADARLAEALDHLELYPARYLHLTRFVRLVVWVRPTTDRASQIVTSASFPALPHAVFLSRRALCHIPPRAIVGESARLLAENLFHESIHQELTIALLRGKLLVPEFRSATSPRVPIPWRADDVPRNSSWPIDRVLHATAVYVNVLEYRLDELADAGLAPELRAGYGEASREACDALAYLLGQMAAHRGLLTGEGLAWLGALAGRGEGVLARFRRGAAGA